MPYSHHSHSGQFCKHAHGTLEEVVKEAIRQGFEVYALTEHVPRYRLEDLYPEEQGTTLDELSEKFDHFVAEAHRLKSLYASKINIIVGLETEYITDLDLQRLEETLATFGNKIEVVVGSVHHVNGIPIDFDEATYERAVASCCRSKSDGGGGSEESEGKSDLTQLSAYLSAYFDAQYELMQRFKPEIIAHFDLCRLYRGSLRFSDFPSVWRKIQRNIQFAVEYGALFEINAAALRKKWDTPYPGRDIVKVIQSVGGKFTLSDDSHGPQFVGLNYDRIPSYLTSMGINELWYLRHSESNKTSASGNRNTQPVKVEGDWSAHEFWKK